MIIYNLFFYLLTPAILLRLLWRGFRAPQYWQRIGERFGFFRATEPLLTAHRQQKKIIWVHAVSVGELLASKPLIEASLSRYSDSFIVLTTTTPTGSEQARKLAGNRIFHVYAPYDFPGSVKRFLRRVQPDLLLIMETEIWPNMITLCHKKNIPTVLVNARLSHRSLQRYQLLQTFSSSIIQKIRVIAAQNQSDVKNFTALSASCVSQTGSIKSDITINDEDLKTVEKYKGLLKRSDRPIVIAASTHKGEDEIVLDALAQLKKKYPSLLLLLAPRHPERFANVAELCRERSFSVVKKSELSIVDQEDIVLIDTIGELFSLFGVSDVAIMGGTFIDRGGHNFLEPAVWGRPIVCGYSDYNFSTIAQALESNHALSRAKSADDVFAQVDSLLSDPVLCQQKGDAAKAYVDNNRGAIERTLQLIDPLLLS